MIPQEGSYKLSVPSLTQHLNTVIMCIVNHILEFFLNLTPLQAFGWLLVQNLLQLALCVGGGWLVVRMFLRNRIFEAPDKLTNREVWLSICCVFFNTLVALAGWAMWKAGIIKIHMSTDFVHALIDVIALVILMDFLMYASHRIVHLPGIYERVHLTHHQFAMTRPLSLFVLNPLEVLGFGFLWLLVLCIYNASWIAIVVYLLLNAAFGALGHVGVEPFPSFWLKIPFLGHLTTSTFHAQHHKDSGTNFGFYTDLWDRLFTSLNQSYETVFRNAATKKQESSHLESSLNQG